jgi:hypothetical protein
MFKNRHTSRPMEKSGLQALQVETERDLLL